MIRLVLTTFSDQDVAAQTVRTLVLENLAACGTILPGARSIYRWNEGLEDSREVVVIFKIATANEDRFFERLPRIHPYEVPEIISIAPERWNEAYGQWVVGKPGG